MTVWSIAFSPLLPLWALYPLGLLALVASIMLVLRRARGAWLRSLAFALLFVGLCDPNLVRENRRPLKDIVAVVVDRSASQTIGERPHQTDMALERLDASLKGLGDVDVRVVQTSREESETEGTKLFSALQGALADAPPERVGGAVMITDGEVHDVPRSAAALGFNAPLHVLVTGHEGERQRRIELIEAPRYGIVGKDQVIAARVLDSADRGEPVKLTVRHDGKTIANIEAVDRRADRHQDADRSCRSQRGRTGSRAGRRRTRDRQQSRGRQYRWRAGQVARPSCLGKAASGRAHVAQPPEIRRQRRSGSFHDPAAAGKRRRRDSDQRAFVDRLPCRGPVRPQDQGLRSDHP